MPMHFRRRTNRRAPGFRLGSRALLMLLMMGGSDASSIRAATAPEEESAPTMPRIAIAEENDGFVGVGTQEPFVPVGFNYDHDHAGRLLEDYWEEEWERVVEDFQEMRSLGANVVRIHLQFGRFMADPATPRDEALSRLERLIELAERAGLYLNLTGLGAYHKEEVPEWYNELDEERRWAAQAVFWTAVAETGAGRPAVFCYDLMNEPVVPARRREERDWLPGEGFGGKHFVQYITLDPGDRERPEVARQWIRRLTSAIRKHDERALLTVGLVPWSLDRPGLQSGFVPSEIGPELDFISVHLYPESEKVDEALETLRGFAVGKPLVIEETFPLKAGPDEWEIFMERSKAIADGWFGFYWGEKPDELRGRGTIGASLTAAQLTQFRKLAAETRRSESDN